MLENPCPINLVINQSTKPEPPIFDNMQFKELSTNNENDNGSQI